MVSARVERQAVGDETKQRNVDILTEKSEEFMPVKKKQQKKIKKSSEVQLGDYVEIELIDSGATWIKSTEPPKNITLSRIVWRGVLVRKDADITALDVGGTIEDKDYIRRSDYHVAWTPSIRAVNLIKRGKKNA